MPPPAGHDVLTVAEMGRADRLTIDAGTPGIDLMENAGAAIARAVVARWSPRPTVVLCGPGNNGGDGFVVARRLRRQGWPVRLALLGTPDRLKGDAALAAARWSGPVDPLSSGSLGDATERPLVVDAVFGAGLVRAIDGVVAETLTRVREARLDSVAVDMPSGVHGDTGKVLGVAAPAVLTVTFCRKKPGHLLEPGRSLCGFVRVFDIGIPDTVVDAVAPGCLENHPAVWRQRLPRTHPAGHKYQRGHALVLGGSTLTGAARLAAMAARRIGAGLVTVVAPEQALPTYAAGSPGTMTAPLTTWPAQLADPKRNAVLIGPGSGVGQATRQAVIDAGAAGKAMVVDADALTSFVGDRPALAAAVAGRAVLTPHEGEFARLFAPDPDGADKLSLARAAAAEIGATVLIKGADTVLADPAGRAIISTHASPALATAGSGDVLAGMILGFLAQGAGSLDAAAAAAWLHGDAGLAVGEGLVAEDLIDALPAVLRRLRKSG